MLSLAPAARTFPLVELMVVLGIIVVLIALLMSAVSAVRIRQQERTTDDIVYKLQQGIETQRKALVDQALADRKTRTPDFVNLVTYCGGDEDRAQALLTYLKLRHSFPQNYSEATTNVTIPGVINWPPHKAYAALPNVSSWSAHEQSAAILFTGLSNLGTGGNSFATDDATGSANGPWTANGVSSTVFKDARGNPVGFRRFFETAELNAAPYTNVKSGNKDPFDPMGKLATVSLPAWTPAQKIQAQGAVGATFDNINKSITAYSFGQDKTPGTGDDVYGYRLLKLGNKGAP
jgi:type II secretory pathway pseudopilin PulG